MSEHKIWPGSIWSDKYNIMRTVEVLCVRPSVKFDRDGEVYVEIRNTDDDFGCPGRRSRVNLVNFHKRFAFVKEGS